MGEKSKDQIQEDLVRKIKSNFTLMAKYIKLDLNNNTNISYSFTKNFDKEDVMKWLASPSKYSSNLVSLSNFLYNASSHYKRLIQYFALMLKYYYYVEPQNLLLIDDLDETKIKKIKLKYFKNIEYVDEMNLSHEFTKISETIWKEDIFYGYEHYKKGSYFIQKLDSKYCAISSIEDGVYNFSFDFLYFDKYKEKLEEYPEEFVTKYNIYKSDMKQKWQELDSKNTICIKLNEDVDYAIPPFAGIFEELYDLEDYKALKLARTELENTAILIEKIPYLKSTDELNQFALQLDLAISYHNKAAAELPSQIGSMLSPFEAVEAITFNTKDTKSDGVSEAEEALYNSAGVSKLIFNSNNASGAALVKSITSDSDIVFFTLRQYERWVNRKLKLNNKKVKAHFLNITSFNQDDVIKRYKEAATLGVPCKIAYATALGMSPMSVNNMAVLENKIFNISENWKPLSSSYTQTDKTAGVDEKDDGDLDDSGTETKESDGNNPDNRDY